MPGLRWLPTPTPPTPYLTTPTTLSTVWCCTRRQARGERRHLRRGNSYLRITSRPLEVEARKIGDDEVCRDGEGTCCRCFVLCGVVAW